MMQQLPLILPRKVLEYMENGRVEFEFNVSKAQFEIIDKVAGHIKSF